MNRTIPPLLRRIACLVATGLGTGRLPKAPGTWGSLLALPLAWGADSTVGRPWAMAGLLGLVILGTWASNAVLDGRHDPSEIVIDEVAGQWATLLAVPPDPLLYGVGFVLFRVADITKPWPACWADQKVEGALGIMLDDLFAAAYAAGALFLISQTWSF